MVYTTKRILLDKRPSGFPAVENFSIDTVTLPQLSEGEILIKIKYLSVDPYMRNRMNKAKSYIEPYETGQPISGDGIAEVLESKNEEYKSGDIISAIVPWQEYAILSGNPYKIPSADNYITEYLGILGLTGLTAYFGLNKIAFPRSGETMVISGAAGAVGMAAGQMAKIYGCRVIGIAGSDEKCAFLKNTLKFDTALNYKTSKNLRKAVKQAAPDGVDIYFDNIGGEISDSIMYLLNDFSRIVLCGQIALYNQNRLSLGPRLNSLLLIHRVKMQGFIVYDYRDEFPAAREQISEWLKNGKLINRETVISGFDQILTAFLNLFQGKNTGKMIVKIA
jgi:NADPH-dependent curcumin reductase CurA